MDLKESQKKNVCRICHQPAKAKGPNDPFVFNYGKEHAHKKCIDWEKESEKKIEQKENEPLIVENLEKEIECLEQARQKVAGGFYGKDTILAMWDGQIKIREAFIGTLNQLEEEYTNGLKMICAKVKDTNKKVDEYIERHDLLVEEIKRITGCKDEDIEFFLGMPGQVRKPIINIKLGEEKQKRFDLEDEIKRKDVQINEAMSILRSGNNYEEPDVINILRNGLSK